MVTITEVKQSYKLELLKYKNALDLIEKEFKSENFQKGLYQINMADEIYNSIKFINHNENEKDINVIEFFEDIVRITLVFCGWLICCKFMKELQIIKIRKQVVTIFSTEELDQLYRELMDFLTQNELVNDDFQKYPEKLIKVTQQDIKLLIRNNKEIININTIQIEENPFSNIENYKLFIYLNEWFKPTGKKAKYSYILEHFQKQREKELLEKPFFEFVTRFKGEFISDRKQPSANNQKYFKMLDDIEQEFIKTNTIVTNL